MEAFPHDTNQVIETQFWIFSWDCWESKAVGFTGTTGIKSDECLEMLEPLIGVLNEAKVREK